MGIMKNIAQSEVLKLKDQVAYQEGQVVSKTLAQNVCMSITLFAFDKDEEISTHESDGDAFVTCLDGVGEVTIDGVKYELHDPWLPRVSYPESCRRRKTGHRPCRSP